MRQLWESRRFIVWDICTNFPAGYGGISCEQEKNIPFNGYQDVYTYTLLASVYTRIGKRDAVINNCRLILIIIVSARENFSFRYCLNDVWK